MSNWPSFRHFGQLVCSNWGQNFWVGSCLGTWFSMFFQLRFSKPFGRTLVLQNLQKWTPNPLEIRFLHYLFFERVLHSMLVRFLVAPNLKNIDFTIEKQWFSRNLQLQTKLPKALFSAWFCTLKSMKNHHNFVRANGIAIFRQFSWNFANFHSILASKIHLQIT